MNSGLKSVLHSAGIFAFGFSLLLNFTESARHPAPAAEMPSPSPRPLSSDGLPLEVHAVGDRLQIIAREPGTGVALRETWISKSGQPDREDGPAMIVRDEKGGIKTQVWMREGREYKPT